MTSEEDLSAMRLRSNSLSQQQQQQRNTIGPDMTVTELAKLMKSQFSTFQRSTKDDIQKMGDRLSSQMTQLRADITADMDKLREDTNKTVSELVSSVEGTKVEVAHAVERSMKRNDLIVSGVPYTQGENLSNYVQVWCRSLGHLEPGMPLIDVRRLMKPGANAGSAPIILLQFAFNIQRNEFYSRYLRSRNLSLSQIGFSVNKRIYINENLTPLAREIRSKALQLKKNGKARSVYSRDGIVYVKLTAGGPEKAIAAIHELDQLSLND